MRKIEKIAVAAIVVNVFFVQDISKQTAVDCIAKIGVPVKFLKAGEREPFIQIAAPAARRNELCGLLMDRPEIEFVRVLAD
jgi:hypothetical protein